MKKKEKKSVTDLSVDLFWSISWTVSLLQDCATLDY